MLGARIFTLALGVCLTIETQSQSSKSGDVTRTPQETRQAASLPDAVKSQNPFASLTEFSATMIGSLMGNVDETKVYRSGNLMRTEMPSGHYFVTDLSTSETYAVLPDRCGHSGATLAYTFPFTFFRPGSTFQRIPLGEGVVDGHHCHIETIVRTTESGSTTHVRFWEADDLNRFPVKIEVDGPGGKVVTIAYKNVRLAPPDPAVFKHPTNCKQVPTPQ